MSKNGSIFKNLHTHHSELINVNIWHLLIEKKYNKLYKLMTYCFKFSYMSTFLKFMC